MKITEWFKNHIVGMLVFAIVTGVGGNYIYAYLSNKYGMDSTPDYKLLYLHPEDVDEKYYVVARVDWGYMLSHVKEVKNMNLEDSGKIWSPVWVGKQPPSDAVKNSLLKKYHLEPVDWMDSADMKNRGR